MQIVESLIVDSRAHGENSPCVSVFGDTCSETGDQGISWLSAHAAGLCHSLQNLQLCALKAVTPCAYGRALHGQESGSRRVPLCEPCLFSVLPALERAGRRAAWWGASSSARCTTGDREIPEGEEARCQDRCSGTKKQRLAIGKRTRTPPNTGNR
jgi:hypothetical protein